MLAKADPVAVEAGPERTCIVTRTKASPDDMIRFVVGPGGVVVPDIRRKLPGRGVWVTARADRVAEAVKRRAFARGFKAKVAASEFLAGEIEELLTQDCLQSLSIANKAGQVVAGFGKVEEAIDKGAIAGLIQAAECGADGARKVGQCLRRRFGSETARPRIELFPSHQLDLALGRTNVIHAALIAGSASEAFLVRCRRLSLYRSAPAQAPTPDCPPGSEEDLN
ncbi:RNA-binding protein [Methylocapsa acidiphila]|uniref:RNA-binding protein n=1 Tax=Methylocapsa acidiphila TaxID=133552 RepID=UPI000426916F|nr:RNA-binding protein [Methylocapsa acidiphila]